MVVVAGSVVFAVAVLVGTLLFSGIWRVGSSYTITAYVYNARGIANDSTVFEAGLPVGLVTGVDRDGPDAILTLRIDQGPRPLPVDSQVQLGLRSLAGEADVLLTLGHSRTTVRNGGSLGLSQDQDYTEVDQILSELTGPNEPKVRQFFQGAGAGVNGEGTNLNNTLGGFASVVNNSPPLTSTIGVQHEQVADIVQNFANIMNSIGQRSEAIKELAQGATTTFDALAARDLTVNGLAMHLPSELGSIAPVTYTLGHGPALTALLVRRSLKTLLVGATRILFNLGSTSPVLSTLVDNVSTAITRLRPSIKLLTPASASGIRLLDALGGASPSLKNLLVNVTQLKPSATKAFPALHALTCQADPMIRFLSPYGNDIAAFFENFGGMTDAYGNPGSNLVTSAHVDPSEIVRGVESQPASSALSALLNFGIFAKTGSKTGYSALLPPGDANDLVPGAGDNGPTQYGRTHAYPHVTADCAK